MTERMSGRARLVGLAAAAAMLAALLPTASGFAAVTPVAITPAAGGTGISTTTAATGGSGAWTSLTGPGIIESVGGQLANATLALSLPAGFEFNPSITTAPVLSGTGCTYTAGALVYLGSGNSSTNAQTTLGGAIGSGACTIQFTALQIRPLTTTPASGNIQLAINGSDAGSAGAVSSVAAAGPLTLVITSPTMNNNAIIWGESYIDIRTSGAAGTNFQIQASTDETTWTPLKNSSGAVLTFTIASSGSSTYRYTPIRNYWYRSVAGATMSNVVRITVRQTCAIRPTHSGTATIGAGSSVTFTTTSRPARSDLPTATVVFQVWHKTSSGSWALYRSLTKAIDANGNASFPWAFTTSGSWYVRAQTQPTSVNSNSFWTPNQYFDVS